MINFRVGMMVRRTFDNFCGMGPGDTDIITRVENVRYNRVNDPVLVLSLKNYGNGHSARNFEIIKLTLSDYNQQCLSYTRKRN